MWHFFVFIEKLTYIILQFVGDFEGSENDFEGNDHHDFETNNQKQYGRRHWERSDRPITKFKEEKVNAICHTSEKSKTKKDFFFFF